MKEKVKKNFEEFVSTGEYNFVNALFNSADKVKQVNES